MVIQGFIIWFCILLFILKPKSAKCKNNAKTKLLEAWNKSREHFVEYWYMGFSLSLYKGLQYSCKDKNQSKNRPRAFSTSNMQTLHSVLSGHNLTNPMEAHYSWLFTKNETEAQRNLAIPLNHIIIRQETWAASLSVAFPKPLSLCSHPWSNNSQLSLCYWTGSRSLHMASFHCSHICWKMLEEANNLLKKWAYGSQFNSKVLSKPCQ